jgi:hypothetical protein
MGVVVMLVAVAVAVAVFMVGLGGVVSIFFLIWAFNLGF